jgi:hypothetical protein
MPHNTFGYQVIGSDGLVIGYMGAGEQARGSLLTDTRGQGEVRCQQVVQGGFLAASLA